MHSVVSGMCGACYFGLCCKVYRESSGIVLDIARRYIIYLSSAAAYQQCLVILHPYIRIYTCSERVLKHPSRTSICAVRKSFEVSKSPLLQSTTSRNLTIYHPSSIRGSYPLRALNRQKSVTNFAIKYLPRT